MTTVLVTGQTSLHWGRMEFGNIGNSYVAEGFFALLRRWLPHAQIATTLEFSAGFLERYSLEPIPREVFDSGPQVGLREAERDLVAAEAAGLTGKMPASSRFLREIQRADLVLDFSGDLWGDNANEIHDERFKVGLLRILCAQILGKKTALVASSPGPFSGSAPSSLVERVLRGYSLILNREPKSSQILATAVGSLDNVYERACPSISYVDGVGREIRGSARETGQPTIGVTLCGWNIPDSSWESRSLSEKNLDLISGLLRRISVETTARVVLFSHSNGFAMEGSKRLDIPGRDYGLLLQIHDYMKSIDEAFPIDLEKSVRNPRETIDLISSFDLLVSGRAHGCVAGLTLGVPTVMIDYANGPVAHKTEGFMELFGQSHRIISLLEPEKASFVISETWMERIRTSQLLSSHLDKNLQLIELMGRELRDLTNGS